MIGMIIMRFALGFGTVSQSVEVPDENIINVLLPNEIGVSVKGEQLVIEALKSPIGTPRLSEIVKPGEKVVIITSDITRPVPSCKIIPHVLEELDGAGIKPEDITIVFALGCHRKQTQEEMKKLVGEEVYNKILCIDSDPEDCVNLGTTEMGTPVDITKVVALADRRICIANIEYHYFAGYSGGAKSVMPGVSSRKAIQNNHSRMVLPEAAAGQIEGNPVRKDIEEAIKYAPIDFIVNVVLDEHKEIIKAVAGHYITAHREGCVFLDLMYRKEISELADIVIVSQGGAPKDMNLYQTQKALDNAKHAVKKGGVIIVVGSCKEGLGEHVFEEWILSAPSAKSMIERIKVDFQLGGHKAAAIAMVLEDADIYLVSEMDADLVRNIFLMPYGTVQEALDAAFVKMGSGASVLVMPYGGSTLPVMAG